MLKIDSDNASQGTKEFYKLHYEHIEAWDIPVALASLIYFIVDLLATMKEDDPELFKVVVNVLNHILRLKEIDLVGSGLRLDGELVELSCHWCGNPIQPFVDEVARIDFDPGVPDSRECPGEPAQVFLVCEDCMEKGAGR